MVAGRGHGARDSKWTSYLVYAGLINIEPINPGTGGLLMDLLIKW